MWVNQQMAEAGRRAWLMGHFLNCHHTERWKLAPVKYLPLGLALQGFFLEYSRVR